MHFRSPSTLGGAVMNLMLQQKKIAFWGVFIAVIWLLQTISFAADFSSAGKKTALSRNSIRSLKVFENPEDYFKRPGNRCG
jgi:hypothetical protein